MTSLTAIFGSSNEKSDNDEVESEKLLNLYWNRAELKKEFAELRDEKVRLQERLAEQEGVAARAQQKLEQLESQLMDTGGVYSTVTHFQLRALNGNCAARIATFAESLKQQREHRIHSRLVAEWTQAREQQATVIKRQLGEQRIQSQMIEDRLQAERHRLATMGGFVKLFRGRSATASLDVLANNIHVAQENERSLLLELDHLQSREPPNTRGLDVATKRNINYMILAYAQKLYLLLRGHDVADLAKEAGEKSAGAINYGDKQTCEQILIRVSASQASLNSVKDFADEVQTRAKKIAAMAKFRGADDAVPVSSSVSTVYELGNDGDTAKTSTVNLLGEDYWCLSKIVSR